ncbi:hypothetical protein AAFF_G00365090, partial [Aldrovandia affinis]
MAPSLQNQVQTAMAAGSVCCGGGGYGATSQPITTSTSSQTTPHFLSPCAFCSVPSRPASVSPSHLTAGGRSCLSSLPGQTPSE